jgi:hypothetical protein
VITDRIDCKYIVPEPDLLALLSENGNRWVVEVVDGRSDQRYETLYFDTRDLAFFHAARGQRPDRYKVRVRRYADTDDAFLEVKHRDAVGRMHKEREPYSTFDAAKPFLRTHLGSAAAMLTELVPTAVTAYSRRALVLEKGQRATIDSDLRLGSEDQFTHRFGGHQGSVVIVETKATGNAPTSLDRALWARGHRPMPVSKYALAIAAVVPGVALNRWTQAARYLQPITEA